MKGFIDNIEERAEKNEDFQHVLYTGKHLQLVLMSLKPGEEIGDEVHKDRDQFFRVEKGKGQMIIDGTTHKIKSDDAIVVPAGSRHNLINTCEKPLDLLDDWWRLYQHLIEPQQIGGIRSFSKESFAGVTTE